MNLHFCLINFYDFILFHISPSLSQFLVSHACVLFYNVEQYVFISLNWIFKVSNLKHCTFNLHFITCIHCIFLLKMHIMWYNVHCTAKIALLKIVKRSQIISRQDCLFIEHSRDTCTFTCTFNCKWKLQVLSAYY